MTQFPINDRFFPWKEHIDTLKMASRRPRKVVISMNWKRHLISAGLTFVTGFLIVLTSEVSTLEVDDVSTGVIVGVILAGIRGGLKVLLELAVKK